MNPMTRHKVLTDGSGQYIEYGGTKYRLNSTTTPAGFIWGDVDASGKPVPDEHGYVLLWNSGLWNDFNKNSKEIARVRQECVTPRGVLTKVCQIINDGVPEETISEVNDGDFPWFYQRGKVYSDSSKSIYSKYTNLHIGLAYERMTAE